MGPIFSGVGIIVSLGIGQIIKDSDIYEDFD
jgi:hypothetical protein